MAQAGLSNRENFGGKCGILNTSPEAASGFVLSSEGEWSVLGAGGGPGMSDSLVARVWHDSYWMVEMHGALGQGMATMHVGEMCFDPQGRITFMVDRFTEMMACGCMRVTTLIFANDGRVTRRDNQFVKIATGEEMTAPESAADFPDVWIVHKLEELSFSAMLKR
jgi:hypothetical protein